MLKYRRELENKMDRLLLLIKRINEITTNYNNTPLDQLIVELEKSAESVQNLIELEE